MSKKKIDPIVKEKIQFIDENSSILINILDNRMEDNSTVLEVVTGIIVSDNTLIECPNFSELKELIDINKNLGTNITNDINDGSNSFGVIFNVAHYVNNSRYSSEIRDRLRMYTSSFNNAGTSSLNYQQFIVFENKNNNKLIKK